MRESEAKPNENQSVFHPYPGGEGREGVIFCHSEPEAKNLVFVVKEKAAARSFNRRGDFRMTSLKTFALSLSLVYFFTNIAFAHNPEKSLWESRQKPPMLARVPETGLSSNLIHALPPSSLLPSQKITERRSSSSAPQAIKSPFAFSSLETSLAQISSRFGHIRDVHVADARLAPVVVLQDVHLNYEAQENIASILSQLKEHSDRSSPLRVGVEGAFEPFDFRRFHAFQNQAVAKIIAEHFLKTNQISAPSYIGLVSAEAAPFLFGVDDPLHYEKNVEAYRASSAARPKVERFLKAERARLEAKKVQLLNPELRAFDELMHRYGAGQLGLGAYLKRLEPLLSESGLDAPLVIEQFRAAYDLENSLNFDRVAHERSRVIEKLLARLPKEELDRLLEMGVSYRLGHLSYGAYYKSIQELLERHQLDLSETPHFENYIRYVLLADGIKAEKLFAAVKDLEINLTAALIQAREEKNLMSASRRLILLERLVDFALTPEEWKEYKSIVESRESRDQGIINEFSSISRLSTIDSQLNLLSFERFYELADLRSAKMVENLLKIRSQETEARSRNKKNSSDSDFWLLTSGFSVLVTGGFHTQAITHHLKRRGISYAVIQPKITRLQEGSATAYLSVFNREKTPIEKMFEGEKLFLADKTMNMGTPSAINANLKGLLYMAFADELPMPAAAGVEAEEISPGVREMRVDGDSTGARYVVTNQPEKPLDATELANEKTPIGHLRIYRKLTAAMLLTSLGSYFLPHIFGMPLSWTLLWAATLALGLVHRQSVLLFLKGVTPRRVVAAILFIGATVGLASIASGQAREARGAPQKPGRSKVIDERDQLDRLEREEARRERDAKKTKILTDYVNHVQNELESLNRELQNKKAQAKKAGKEWDTRFQEWKKARDVFEKSGTLENQRSLASARVRAEETSLRRASLDVEIAVLEQRIAQRKADQVSYQAQLAELAGNGKEKERLEKELGYLKKYDVPDAQKKREKAIQEQTAYARLYRYWRGVQERLWLLEDVSPMDSSLGALEKATQSDPKDQQASVKKILAENLGAFENQQKTLSAEVSGKKEQSKKALAEAEEKFHEWRKAQSEVEKKDTPINRELMAQRRVQLAEVYVKKTNLDAEIAIRELQMAQAKVGELSTRIHLAEMNGDQKEAAELKKKLDNAQKDVKRLTQDRDHAQKLQAEAAENLRRQTSILRRYQQLNDPDRTRSSTRAPGTGTLASILNSAPVQEWWFPVSLAALSILDLAGLSSMIMEISLYAVNAVLFAAIHDNASKTTGRFSLFAFGGKALGAFLILVGAREMAGLLPLSLFFIDLLAFVFTLPLHLGWNPLMDLIGLPEWKLALKDKNNIAFEQKMVIEDLRTAIRQLTSPSKDELKALGHQAQVRIHRILLRYDTDRTHFDLTPGRVEALDADGNRVILNMQVIVTKAKSEAVKAAQEQSEAARKQRELEFINALEALEEASRAKDPDALEKALAHPQLPSNIRDAKRMELDLLKQQLEIAKKIAEDWKVEIEPGKNALTQIQKYLIDMGERIEASGAPELPALVADYLRFIAVLRERDLTIVGVEEVSRWAREIREAIEIIMEADEKREATPLDLAHLYVILLSLYQLELSGIHKQNVLQVNSDHHFPHNLAAQRFEGLMISRLRRLGLHGGPRAGHETQVATLEEYDAVMNEILAAYQRLQELVLLNTIDTAELDLSESFEARLLRQRRLVWTRLLKARLDFAIQQLHDASWDVPASDPNMEQKYKERQEFEKRAAAYETELKSLRRKLDENIDKPQKLLELAEEIKKAIEKIFSDVSKNQLLMAACPQLVPALRQVYACTKKHTLQQDTEQAGPGLVGTLLGTDGKGKGVMKEADAGRAPAAGGAAKGANALGSGSTTRAPPPAKATDTGASSGASKTPSTPKASSSVSSPAGPTAASKTASPTAAAASPASSSSAGKGSTTPSASGPTAATPPATAPPASGGSGGGTGGPTAVAPEFPEGGGPRGPSWGAVVKDYLRAVLTLRNLLRLMALAIAIGIMILMVYQAESFVKAVLRSTDLTSHIGQMMTLSQTNPLTGAPMAAGFWWGTVKVTYLGVRLIIIVFEFLYLLTYGGLRRLFGVSGGVYYSYKKPQIDAQGDFVIGAFGRIKYVRVRKNDGVEVDFFSSADEIKRALLSRFPLITEAELGGFTRAQLFELYQLLDKEEARLAEAEAQNLKRFHDEIKHKPELYKPGNESNPVKDTRKALASSSSPLVRIWGVIPHFIIFLRDFFFESDLKRYAYRRYGRFINHFGDAAQARPLIEAAIAKVKAGTPKIEKDPVEVRRSGYAALDVREPGRMALAFTSFWLGVVWYWRNNIALMGLLGYMYRRIRITIFGGLAGLVANAYGLWIFLFLFLFFPTYYLIQGYRKDEKLRERPGSLVFDVFVKVGVLLIGWALFLAATPVMGSIVNFELDSVIRDHTVIVHPDGTIVPVPEKAVAQLDYNKITQQGAYVLPIDGWAHVNDPDSFIGRYIVHGAIYHLSFSMPAVISTFFTAFGLNLHGQVQRIHRSLVQNTANPFKADPTATAKHNLEMDYIPLQKELAALAPEAKDKLTKAVRDNRLAVLARAEALLDFQQARPWYKDWTLRRFSIGRFSDTGIAALHATIEKSRAAVVEGGLRGAEEEAGAPFSDDDKRLYRGEALLDYDEVMLPAQREAVQRNAPPIASGAVWDAVTTHLGKWALWRSQFKSMWGMWTLGAEIAMVVEAAGDVGGGVGKSAGFVAGLGDEDTMEKYKEAGHQIGHNAANLLEGEQDSAMSLMGDLQGQLARRIGVAPRGEDERYKEFLTNGPPKPSRPAKDKPPEKPPVPPLVGPGGAPPGIGDYYRWVRSPEELAAARWDQLRKWRALKAGDLLRDPNPLADALEAPDIPLDNRGVPLMIVDEQGNTHDPRQEFIPQNQMFLKLQTDDARVRPIPMYEAKMVNGQIQWVLRPEVFDSKTRTFSPPPGLAQFQFMPQPLNLAADGNPFSDHRGRPLRDMAGRLIPQGVQVRRGVVEPNTGLRASDQTENTVSWRDPEGNVTPEYPRGKSATAVDPQTGNEIIFGNDIVISLEQLEQAEQDLKNAEFDRDLRREKMADRANVALVIDRANRQIIGRIRSHDDLPKESDGTPRLRFERIDPLSGNFIAYDPRVEDVRADRITIKGEWKDKAGKVWNDAEIEFTLHGEKESKDAARNAEISRSKAVVAHSARAFPGELAGLQAGTLPAYLFAVLPTGEIRMFPTQQSANDFMHLTLFRRYPGAQRDAGWNWWANQLIGSLSGSAQALYSVNEFTDPVTGITVCNNNSTYFTPVWLSWYQQNYGRNRVFGVMLDENMKDLKQFTDKEWFEQRRQASRPTKIGETRVEVQAKTEKGATYLLPQVLTQEQSQELAKKGHLRLPNGAQIIRSNFGAKIDNETGRITKVYDHPVHVYADLERPDLLYELADGDIVSTDGSRWERRGGRFQRIPKAHGEVFPNKLLRQDIKVVTVHDPQDNTRIETGTEWSRLEFMRKEAVRKQQQLETLRSGQLPPPVVGIRNTIKTVENVPVLRQIPVPVGRDRFGRVQWRTLPVYDQVELRNPAFVISEVGIPGPWHYGFEMDLTNEVNALSAQIQNMPDGPQKLVALRLLKKMMDERTYGGLSAAARGFKQIIIKGTLPQQQFQTVKELFELDRTVAFETITRSGGGELKIADGGFQGDIQAHEREAERLYHRWAKATGAEKTRIAKEIREHNRKFWEGIRDRYKKLREAAKDRRNAPKIFNMRVFEDGDDYKRSLKAQRDYFNRLKEDYRKAEQAEQNAVNEAERAKHARAKARAASRIERASRNNSYEDAQGNEVFIISPVDAAADEADKRSFKARQGEQLMVISAAVARGETVVVREERQVQPNGNVRVLHHREDAEAREEAKKKYIWQKEKELDDKLQMEPDKNKQAAAWAQLDKELEPVRRDQVPFVIRNAQGHDEKWLILSGGYALHEIRDPKDPDDEGMHILIEPLENGLQEKDEFFAEHIPRLQSLDRVRDFREWDALNERINFAKNANVFVRTDGNTSHKWVLQFSVPEAQKNLDELKEKAAAARTRAAHDDVLIYELEKDGKLKRIIKDKAEVEDRLRKKAKQEFDMRKTYQEKKEEALFLTRHPRTPDVQRKLGELQREMGDISIQIQKSDRTFWADGKQYVVEYTLPVVNEYYSRFSTRIGDEEFVSRGQQMRFTLYDANNVVAGSVVAVRDQRAGPPPADPSQVKYQSFAFTEGKVLQFDEKTGNTRIERRTYISRAPPTPAGKGQLTDIIEEWIDPKKRPVAVIKGRINEHGKLDRNFITIHRYRTPTDEKPAASFNFRYDPKTPFEVYETAAALAEQDKLWAQGPEILDHSRTKDADNELLRKIFGEDELARINPKDVVVAQRTNPLGNTWQEVIYKGRMMAKVEGEVDLAAPPGTNGFIRTRIIRFYYRDPDYAALDIASGAEVYDYQNPRRRMGWSMIETPYSEYIRTRQIKYVRMLEETRDVLWEIKNQYGEFIKKYALKARRDDGTVSPDMPRVLGPELLEWVRKNYRPFNVTLFFYKYGDKDNNYGDLELANLAYTMVCNEKGDHPPLTYNKKTEKYEGSYFEYTEIVGIRDTPQGKRVVYSVKVKNGGTVDFEQFWETRAPQGPIMERQVGHRSLKDQFGTESITFNDYDYTGFYGKNGIANRSKSFLVELEKGQVREPVDFLKIPYRPGYRILGHDANGRVSHELHYVAGERGRGFIDAKSGRRWSLHELSRFSHQDVYRIQVIDEKDGIKYDLLAADESHLVKIKPDGTLIYRRDSYAYTNENGRMKRHLKAQHLDQIVQGQWKKSLDLNSFEYVEVIFSDDKTVASANSFKRKPDLPLLKLENPNDVDEMERIIDMVKKTGNKKEARTKTKGYMGDERKGIPGNEHLPDLRPQYWHVTGVSHKDSDGKPLYNSDVWREVNGRKVIEARSKTGANGQRQEYLSIDLTDRDDVPLTTLLKRSEGNRVDFRYRPQNDKPVDVSRNDFLYFYVGVEESWGGAKLDDLKLVVDFTDTRPDGTKNKVQISRFFVPGENRIHQPHPDRVIELNAVSIVTNKEFLVAVPVSELREKGLDITRLNPWATVTWGRDGRVRPPTSGLVSSYIYRAGLNQEGLSEAVLLAHGRHNGQTNGKAPEVPFRMDVDRYRAHYFPPQHVDPMEYADKVGLGNPNEDFQVAIRDASGNLVAVLRGYRYGKEHVSNVQEQRRLILCDPRRDGRPLISIRVERDEKGRPKLIREDLEGNNEDILIYLQQRGKFIAVHEQNPTTKKPRVPQTSHYDISALNPAQPFRMDWGSFTRITEFDGSDLRGRAYNRISVSPFSLVANWMLYGEEVGAVMEGERASDQEIAAAVRRFENDPALQALLARVMDRLDEINELLPQDEQPQPAEIEGHEKEPTNWASLLPFVNGNWIGAIFWMLVLWPVWALLYSIYWTRVREEWRRTRHVPRGGIFLRIVLWPLFFIYDLLRAWLRRGTAEEAADEAPPTWGGRPLLYNEEERFEALVRYANNVQGRLVRDKHGHEVDMTNPANWSEGILVSGQDDIEGLFSQSALNLYVMVHSAIAKANSRGSTDRLGRLSNEDAETMLFHLDCFIRGFNKAQAREWFNGDMDARYPNEGKHNPQQWNEFDRLMGVWADRFKRAYELHLQGRLSLDDLVKEFYALLDELVEKENAVDKDGNPEPHFAFDWQNEPFDVRDLNIVSLRSRLKNPRPIDLPMLWELGVGVPDVATLHMPTWRVAVDGFSDARILGAIDVLLKKANLCTVMELDALNLPIDMVRLRVTVRNKLRRKKTLTEDERKKLPWEIKRLNEAIFWSLYSPQMQKNPDEARFRTIGQRDRDALPKYKFNVQKVKEMVKAQQWASVPNFYEVLARYLLKLAAVIVGILMLRGGAVEINGMAGTDFFFGDTMGLLIVLGVMLAFIINSFTESRAIYEGREMNYLTSLPRVILPALVMLIIWNVMQTANTLSFSMFVILGLIFLLMAVEALGIFIKARILGFGGNRSLFGVFAWYTFRPPAYTATKRDETVIWTVYFLFAIAAIFIGTYVVMPWMIEKYDVEKWKVLAAGIRFLISLLILHNAINMVARSLIIKKLFRRLFGMAWDWGPLSEEKKPEAAESGADGGDTPEEDASDRSKVAFMYAGGQDLRSRVFKNGGNVANTCAQMGEFLMNRLSLAYPREAVLDLFRAAATDPRFHPSDRTHVRNVVARGDEKELVNIFTTWYRHLLNAEVNAGTTMFDLGQMYDPTLDEDLKVAQGADISDRQRAAIEHSWEIARYLYQTGGFPFLTTSTDVGLNLPQIARSAARAGIAHRAVFVVEHNEYNAHFAADPGTGNKWPFRADISGTSELGQRMKLVRLIKHLAPGAEACVKHVVTAQTSKAGLMSASYLWPEIFSQVGHIITLDQNSTYLDSDLLWGDVRRMWANPNMVLMISQRTLPNRDYATTDADGTAEGGHFQEMLSGVPIVGTGWGSILRIMQWDLMAAYADPSVRFVARGGRPANWMAQLFGADNYAYQTIGISEDWWQVIGAVRVYIGLMSVGKKKAPPELGLTRSLAFRARSGVTGDIHARIGDMPRWVAGAEATKNDSTMQQGLMFGPHPLSIKELRATELDIWTLYPVTFLFIMTDPWSVIFDFSPFVGIMVGLFFFGLFMNQSSTLFSRDNNIFHMGKIPGRGRWWATRIPDVMTWAFRETRGFLAHITGLIGPNPKFDISGGGTKESPWRSIAEEPSPWDIIKEARQRNKDNKEKGDDDPFFWPDFWDKMITVVKGPHTFKNTFYFALFFLFLPNAIAVNWLDTSSSVMMVTFLWFSAAAAFGAFVMARKRGIVIGRYGWGDLVFRALGYVLGILFMLVAAAIIVPAAKNGIGLLALALAGIVFIGASLFKWGSEKRDEFERTGRARHERALSELGRAFFASFILLGWFVFTPMPAIWRVYPWNGVLVDLWPINFSSLASILFISALVGLAIWITLDIIRGKKKGHKEAQRITERYQAARERLIHYRDELHDTTDIEAFRKNADMEGIVRGLLMKVMIHKNSEAWKLAHDELDKLDKIFKKKRMDEPIDDLRIRSDLRREMLDFKRTVSAYKVRPEVTRSLRKSWFWTSTLIKERNKEGSYDLAKSHFRKMKHTFDDAIRLGKARPLAPSVPGASGRWKDSVLMRLPLPSPIKSGLAGGIEGVPTVGIGIALLTVIYSVIPQAPPLIKLYVLLIATLPIAYIIYKGLYREHRQHGVLISPDHISRNPQIVKAATETASLSLLVLPLAAIGFVLPFGWDVAVWGLSVALGAYLHGRKNFNIERDRLEKLLLEEEFMEEVSRVMKTAQKETGNSPQWKAALKHLLILEQKGFGLNTIGANQERVLRVTPGSLLHTPEEMESQLSNPASLIEWLYYVWQMPRNNEPDLAVELIRLHEVNLGGPGIQIIRIPREGTLDEVKQEVHALSKWVNSFESHEQEPVSLLLEGRNQAYYEELNAQYGGGEISFARAKDIQSAEDFARQLIRLPKFTLRKIQIVKDRDLALSPSVEKSLIGLTQLKGYEDLIEFIIIRTLAVGAPAVRFKLPLWLKSKAFRERVLTGA